jgi:transposase-like protein
MRDFSNPIFHDDEAARAYIESLRWANGRFCPHCGETERTSPIAGTKHRPGLFVCLSCKVNFTVTVGTVMERTHIPLHKWAAAFVLLTASKKGISAHQIHRMLGISYKSAWFMCHRIREAMKEGAFPGPLGGAGKQVEADETFIGRKPGHKVRQGTAHKHAVVSLVERGGRVRSFHVERVNAKTVRDILVTQADRKSDLMTDEARYYKTVGKEFASHESVNHDKDEYVRGLAHTNTIEGYYSIFKRGMIGVYQHCGEAHLKRYLVEFDFRYSNRVALGVDDTQRAAIAIKGIEGRRLTYRRTH